MSQASKLLPKRQPYLVALGSNLPTAEGTPAQTLSLALNYTQSYSCQVVNLSKFFRSPAFPAGSGPDFVNAAAEIHGPEDPREMLAILHGIEARLGRERKTRWAPRVIDLDLLAAGGLVLPDPETQAIWQGLTLEEQMRRAPDELVLPHPRIQDRAFVLLPLLDIAPDWTHPVLGRTVREMCEALPHADRDALTSIEAP